MVTFSPHNVLNIEESEIECSRLKQSKLLNQRVIQQKVRRRSDSELRISTPSLQHHHHPRDDPGQVGDQGGIQ